ncbi:hypothetical protein [Arcanobacterium phocae]|nr:hypothetical protein [Arcanobacterium phocae]
MIRFIDEYRKRFSTQFICTTLNTDRVGGLWLSSITILWCERS